MVFCNMVIKWCEREYEEAENLVLEDDESLEVLRQCVLKNFFNATTCGIKPNASIND